MGIRYMSYLLDNYQSVKKGHLSQFSKKKVAIDTNLFLYKFLYQYGNVIDGLFLMYNKFHKFNITPIFVFDGRPPVEKTDIIEKRKKRRDVYKEQLQEIDNQIEDVLKSERLNEVQKNEMLNVLKKKKNQLEKRIIIVTKETVDLAIEFLTLIGVKYIRLNCEGEHLCSYLSKENLVDAVITDDMDAIACGSKIVIRGFNTKTDEIDVINLVELLHNLKLNFSQFQELCILLGTEYGPYNEEWYMEKNKIPELVEILQKYTSIKNFNIQLETSTQINTETITHINLFSYISKYGEEFIFKVNRIKDIFNLKEIQLEYKYRSYIVFEKISADFYKLKEFMRIHSSLPEQTVINRIQYFFLDKNMVI
jgi:5'-3' exonuclease